MSNKTGVYKITNKINGKVYYGSAISFEKRWKEHISYLKRKAHDNIHLQSAWNKYGDTFEFSIVIECQPEECLMYEQMCLDLYWDGGNNCYNINPVAGKPPSRLGQKHSLETRQKLSEITKSNPSKYWFGKTIPPEIRDKQSRVKLGKTYKPTEKFLQSAKLAGEQKAKKFTFNGKTLTIKKWAAKLGISYASLWERLNNGWPIEKALTTTNAKKFEKGL